MRNKQTAKTTVFRSTTVQLPEIITKAMKKHSRNIPDCPRPNIGSMNHFAVYATLKVLQVEFGENFKYLYPEYYH